MVVYSGLVVGLLAEVDIILENYVYDGYQAMVDYLEAPLGVAIILFFVCYGISLTQGWLQGSIGGLLKSLFKIGLIYFLGMNWGNFSEYVCSLFYDAAGQIGDVLVHASPIELPIESGGGINDALQSVLSELWKIAQWVFDNGGIANPGPWIGGVLMGLVGCLLVALALLEMVVAKCMLSILFVTAPLFIAFTLFKSTQVFFDRWLGACVGYAMLMIFVCAGLGIIIALDHWVLVDAYAVKGVKIKFLDTGTAILVTWVCIGILRRIAGLAMHIGDSVTTISGHELVASAVGGFISGHVSRIPDAQKKHGPIRKRRPSRASQSDDEEHSSAFRRINYTMKKLRSGGDHA